MGRQACLPMDGGSDGGRERGREGDKRERERDEEPPAAAGRARVGVARAAMTWRAPTAASLETPPPRPGSRPVAVPKDARLDTRIDSDGTWTRADMAALGRRAGSNEYGRGARRAPLGRAAALSVRPTPSRRLGVDSECGGATAPAGWQWQWQQLAALAALAAARAV